MALFVEARPKGRQEGSPIEGYVVEDHVDDELADFDTQGEAIQWAKSEGHVLLWPAFETLMTRTSPTTGELFRTLSVSFVSACRTPVMRSGKTRTIPSADCETCPLLQVFPSGPKQHKSDSNEPVQGG